MRNDAGLPLDRRSVLVTIRRLGLRPGATAALAIASIAALACLPWAIAYWTIYASPFGPSAVQLVRRSWTGAIGWPLVGVLFSPARGMLLYQPWVVLAMLAFVPAMRRAAACWGCGNGPPGWLWFCGGVILFQIGLVSAWTAWWGGWCWGSRLVAEVLPLCALLTLGPVTVLSRFTTGRRLMLTLAIAGLLMQIPFVYFGAGAWNYLVDIDNHTNALWSWSRAPFLLPILVQAASEKLAGECIPIDSESPVD